MGCECDCNCDIDDLECRCPVCNPEKPYVSDVLNHREKIQNEYTDLEGKLQKKYGPNLDDPTIQFSKKDIKRIDELNRIKDNLCPISLSEISLPQIPYVRVKKSYFERIYNKDPDDLDADETYICLGEIAQAPGHVVLAGKNGRLIYMIHSSDLEIVTLGE